MASRMGHLADLVHLPLLALFRIGHSAVFLIGGPTRDEAPLAILLESGDGLIMSGAGRRLFHGEGDFTSCCSWF